MPMNTITNTPISGDIRAALRLEALSIGWMVIEASASIGAGSLPGACCCWPSAWIASSN